MFKFKYVRVISVFGVILNSILFLWYISRKLAHCKIYESYHNKYYVFTTRLCHFLTIMIIRNIILCTSIGI